MKKLREKQPGNKKFCLNCNICQYFKKTISGIRKQNISGGRILTKLHFCVNNIFCLFEVKF